MRCVQAIANRGQGAGGFLFRRGLHLQHSNAQGAVQAGAAGGFSQKGFLQALGVEGFGAGIVAAGILHALQVVAELVDLLFLRQGLLLQITHGDNGLLAFAGQATA